MASMTRSYRTYEEWKPGSGCVQVGQLSDVLTVPMRNGNLREHAEDYLAIGSYRTYEEWKLLHSHEHNGKYDSSYRTYEEWKLQERHTVHRLQGARSYRTYEEWKHNGKYEPTFKKEIVLTVPMRNGNNGYGMVFQQVLRLFLPYL